jgi:hypothetical protein
MKPRTASRLSWSLAGVVLTLVAATWVLVLLNRDVIHNLEQARPIELVLPIGFAVMGALVASRQPGNTFNSLPALRIERRAHAIEPGPSLPAERLARVARAQPPEESH